MKKINCNIIKDLMQNYIDGVSSEATNELIETHIKTCKECDKVLEEMRKDIELTPLLDQDEQIDYLKGYRKKSIVSIITSIIVTILILFNCILLIICFLQNTEFFVNIQDIFVSCMNEEKVNEKNTFLFRLYGLRNVPNLKCYTYEVVEENTGLKVLHIKTVGKFQLGKVVGANCYVEIDETIDKIYLEDKKGNIREIWNKELGLQLKKEIYYSNN